jgi:hypothetical protein
MCTSIARFIRLCVTASLAALTALSSHAAPAFTAVDIGYGIPLDVNRNGLVLGTDTYAGTQPWVFDGSAKVMLPLPAGSTAANAARLGDSGTVVGQVGNQAAVWWPLAGGGYSVELLPFPPGATTGRAVDVNGPGTVLVSYGTPTRLVTGYLVWSYRPWLYRRGTGLIDPAPASASFASEAMDFTDSGRILLQSGEVVEPDGSLTAAPPFPPRPPGGPGWIFFRAARINEAGAFVGVATLSSSNNAQVVRYAPGAGWQVLGGLSLNVSALGIDAESNALMMANWVCPSAFGLSYNVPGSGTYCLDDLVLGGGWSFTSLSARGALASSGTPGSGAGALVALGYNTGAGTWRLARLVPAASLPPPPAVSLAAVSHPGTWQQPYDSIHLTWTSGGSLAKGYVIERKSPGSNSFVEVARLGASYAQYDDTAITPLASYSYRMAVIGLAGMGPYSNVASATAPPPMDRTAPTVTISAPTEGATVSGTVTVSATFADAVGVSYASFSFAPTMSSGLICTRAPSVVAPTLTVSCRWDTRNVANRSPTATVTAYAQDAIGNWVQQSVNVNVSYRKGR